MAYKLSHSSTSSATRNTTAASGEKAASGRLDRHKYAKLLAGALPRVIENDSELERIAQSLEPLLDRGARRTREEEALCCLLLRLIDDYQKAHPRIPRLPPSEALKALLEARNLRQIDLVPIFGSRSRISDAVNGKREISKSHARKLAQFFQVSPDLFI